MGTVHCIAVAGKQQQRKLDPAVLVERALAIADAEGLGAVSMRRLAADLGVTAMALYHHVANKEQLLDLMADASLTALPLLDPDAPWDAELERFFTAFYDLFVGHPALAAVMSERPLLGPTASQAGDRVLERLIDAGFSDRQAVAALVTLVNYTVGASLYTLSRSTPARAALQAVTADTAPTAHRLRAELRAAVGPDQFRDGLVQIIRSYDARGGKRHGAA